VREARWALERSSHRCWLPKDEGIEDAPVEEQKLRVRIPRKMANKIQKRDIDLQNEAWQERGVLRRRREERERDRKSGGGEGACVRSAFSINGKTLWRVSSPWRSPQRPNLCTD
jgi:hypothetical protein